MAKIEVLDIKGKKVESITVSDNVFTIEPNKQAIYDAVILQRANMRQGTHSVKGRSDVRGGGKKPYKQKGTGRARQGTTRAPQWRGGGVVFGPTPRSYAIKMNKKVRRLALKSAIAEKFSNGEIIVLDKIDFKAPKTSEMVKIMNVIGAVRKPLLITAEYDENIFLAGRNIPGLINLDVVGMNVLDVVNAHKLVITKEAITKIEEVLG
ncbi:MAG: 50S ribosomal protein L4 [Mycoplasmatales bacterium]